MYITKHEKHQTIILELDGRLDNMGAITLEEALLGVYDINKSIIVLDMSHVDYVNSSGLRVIARFLKLSQENHRELRLFGAMPNITRALEIVGLDSFFPKYDSLQAALSN